MWPGPGPEKDSPPLCRQGVGTHRAWLFALRDGTAGCAGSSPCFRNVYERIRLIWGNSPDSGIFLQWPQVTCAKHGCGISKKRRLGLHKLTQQGWIVGFVSLLADTYLFGNACVRDRMWSEFAESSGVWKACPAFYTGNCSHRRGSGELPRLEHQSTDPRNTRLRE